MESPYFVIEIHSRGGDIRLLTESERASLMNMDLRGFDFWKYDGEERFWAFTYTAEQIRKHGFSMTDQHSKNHGFHVTDFVDIGNGVYEYYEEGFEKADELLRQFGSFLYFFPEYSWGYDGCQILSPETDLRAVIPSCFADMIARKRLAAMSVTSDVGDFLEECLEHVSSIDISAVKVKALKIGAVSSNA